MKSRINPFLRISSLAIIAITFGALPGFAGTTWDGTGTPDTSIDLAANWDLDVLPDLTGPALVTFTSANNTATVNAAVEFTRVTFGASFTLASGSGSLTIRGTNSGANSSGILSNSAASNVQINEPVLVEAVATAAPLGNLLLIGNSHNVVDTTALNINGGIALAPTSTVASYNIRYGNGSGGTSDTRIAGPISGLGGLFNSSNSLAWAGDLTIAGSQALSNSDITISSAAGGFTNPTTAARLVLGESAADTQTWKNITLNNVMNLAIGGNITAGIFSGNTVNTKITGASATGNISLNSGTIGANVVLGGAGTNENNLSLIKKTSGTLNINSTTATYTGATIVEAGVLNIASALASPITVQSGGVLGGEGSTTNSLTFGSGNTTINFDPATQTAAFTAASVDLSAAGLVGVSPTATLTNGVPYAVLKRSSGTFSVGDLAKFVPGSRGTVTRTNSNTEITLTPTTAASIVWAGNSANPTFWDVATTQNWTNGGSPDRFYAGDAVTFNDTTASFAIEVQGSSVNPGNMVFSNSTNDYTVSGGTIGGSGSLTKSGSGTLTLTQAGTNSFSGPLNLVAGTLSISNLNQIGGSASTRAITLKGGTLNFTGATQTSDVMPLILDSGTSTISVATSGNTLRIGSATTGSGNLIKSGLGILSLGKNSVTTLGNTFTGTILATSGELDIRNPDSLGATSGGTTMSNALLSLFAFGQNAGVTFDAEPITLSNTSFLRSKNEDVDSDITNTLTGPVTVSASAQAGLISSKAVTVSGGVITATSTNVSKLVLTGGVSTGAGSTLKLGQLQVGHQAGLENVMQEVEINAVSGAGSVSSHGSADSLYSVATPTYSGNTTVNGGILKLGADNANNNASTVTIATSGATLQLDFAGTDTVAQLFIGGVQQAAGVYKAIGNAATGTAIAQITGTGTLTVTASPTGGYSAWASLYAPGQTVDQDHDLDGLDNGAEYFMGATGSSFTANPGVVAGTVTWPMGASYTGVYGTDYLIQTSANLTSWSLVPAGSLTISSGTSVSYTLPVGSPKLFTRLVVNPN